MKFTHAAAVDFLVRRGCDREQILGGSIPERHLEFIWRHVAEIPAAGPLNGLQIGTFVGISLAYFAQRVSGRRGGHIYAIDPDLPHRGIDHPLAHARALLEYFGVDGSATHIVGYSLEKSRSNDGLVFCDYDPAAMFRVEAAPQRRLDAMVSSLAGALHFAVIDGNHEAGYLAREIHALGRLLCPGGLIFIDDAVSAALDGHCRGAPGGLLEVVACDGRIGVLRRPAHPRPGPSADTGGAALKFCTFFGVLMEDVILLFLYHRHDATTLEHYREVLRWHSRAEVIPLAYQLRVPALPGTVDLADLEDFGWPVHDAWRNTDKVVYRWFLQPNAPRARRYVIFEWDILAKAPAPVFYGRAWDADLAAVGVIYPESTPGWPYWAAPGSPGHASGLSCGIPPLAATLWSHQALSRISGMRLLQGESCEFRAATLARMAGFQPTTIPGRNATVSWNTAHIRVTAEPTWFHPVKAPAPVYRIHRPVRGARAET